MAGVERSVDFSIETGAWDTQSDGTRIWMLDVTSPEAKVVRLHFRGFALPRGAQLFVSSPSADNGSPIENQGPYGNGEFFTSPVSGNSVHIELLLPAGADAPEFRIIGVSHIFVDPRDALVGDPAPCELDATCYPDWSGSGDSVARIMFSDANYVYLCSAVLLNNSSSDFSPLLLTANHCISDYNVANSLVAYWFFKTGSCNGTADIATSPTSMNANLIATSPGSDATLLQLLGAPPENVSWAAWSTTDPTPGDNVTAIHHPLGSFRHIAFGAEDVVNNFPYFDNVHWTSGIDEPGSSGGPLFNQAHEVIGQLYGGYSSCTRPGPDYFGQLSASYPHFTDANGNNFLQQGLPDDNLPANHAREQAYSITTPALIQNVVLKKNVDDWFRLTVAANQGVTVNTSYFPLNGTIGMEIYKNNESTPLTLDPYSAITFNNPDTANDYYIHLFLTRGVRLDYQLAVSTQSPPLPTISVRNPDGFHQYHGVLPIPAVVDGHKWPVTTWVEYSSDPNFATLRVTAKQSIAVPFAQQFTATTEMLAPALWYYRGVAQSVGGSVTSDPQSKQVVVEAPTPVFPVDNGSSSPYANMSLRWDGTVADSYDVYLGPADNMAFLGATSEFRFDVSSYPFQANTTYSWNVAAHYGPSTTSFLHPATFFTGVLLRVIDYNTDLGWLPLYHTSTPTYSFEILNTSYVPVQITNIVATGDFSYWDPNNCRSAVVAPQSWCSIYPTFTPTALGTRTGTITVFSNIAPPISTAVTGFGADIPLTLTRPARPTRSTNGIFSNIAPPISTAVTGFGADIPLTLTRPARPTRSTNGSTQFELSVPYAMRENVALACEVISGNATCAVSAEADGDTRRLIMLQLVSPAENHRPKRYANIERRKDDRPAPIAPGVYTVRVTATVAGESRSLEVPILVP